MQSETQINPLWPVLTLWLDFVQVHSVTWGAAKTPAQLSYLMLQLIAVGQVLVLGHWPITHTHTEGNEPNV